LECYRIFRTYEILLRWKYRDGPISVRYEAFPMPENLLQFLYEHDLLAHCSLSREEMARLSSQIEERFLADYFGRMVRAIEDVMNISPALEWREILEAGALHIVQALGGDAGSIRLYDPSTGALVSFGSYQFREESRIRSIPVENSIAGRVMRSGRSHVVPDILTEPLYRDKSQVERLGLRSMMAVPLKIPRFLETEQEILGAVQIYYREKDRRFDPLEITYAEVLARRISHVVARKRIMDLYQLNVRKEKLVEKIFLKLSNREGIKMQDLFGLMVSELTEILAVSSCALFSVSRDGGNAWLEIFHPVTETFIEDGHTFELAAHPYMAALLERKEAGTGGGEKKVPASHILIRDPECHALSGPALSAYSARHGVQTVLLVPLHARGVLSHFMMFCSPEGYSEFNEWEIELLAFFGKEVMQALRMERLDDILHDLKNPAIAIGGFARRARRLMEFPDPNAVRDRVLQALDILVEETDRIQSLSTSASIEGRERFVDIGQTLKRRFRLNAEAVRERGLDGISVTLGPVDTGLLAYCAPFELERILDNLLANATEALPAEGGELSARCSKEGDFAEVAIRNSGVLTDEEMQKLFSGKVRGRGFGIAQRFVQTLGGELRVSQEEAHTVVVVRVPLVSSRKSA